MACRCSPISIGLEREGQLVAGVVYNPANDDMFVAERGQGAYLQQPPPARRRTARYGRGADRLRHPAYRQGGGPRALSSAEFAAVLAKAGNLRRLGAAALDLCFVAAGNYDGFWERGLKSWDVAAGIVVIKEAGGFVTDADGGSDMLGEGSICAGNDFIHRALLGLIKQA